MIRILDLILSFFGLLFLTPLLILLFVVTWFDIGSPIFIQERVGRFQKRFFLIKLRTMPLDTNSVATHLVDTSKITDLGKFLRRTKLDELPQLWNVFRGDMSLVGPRPCLFNQEELIIERASRGVFCHRPGITGLAQVRGVDMSTPELLAELDAELVRNLNVFGYLGYIFLTLFGKRREDNPKR
jgi:O-antigen biosynthesis protein WbqP